MNGCKLTQIYNKVKISRTQYVNQKPILFTQPNMGFQSLMLGIRNLIPKVVAEFMENNIELRKTNTNRSPQVLLPKCLKHYHPFVLQSKEYSMYQYSLFKTKKNDMYNILCKLLKQSMQKYKSWWTELLFDGKDQQSSSTPAMHRMCT